MQQNRNRRDNYAAHKRNRTYDPVNCALVLAGGEGKRLRPFVHLLREDLLPKQYVNFIGRRSMLEHTLDRAEKLAPRERVFTIINRNHLIFPEVTRQVAARHPGTMIVQPQNKETAPGILFSLIHIAKRYPDSIVTLLPSDHFVMEEDELTTYLSTAYRWVKRDSSRIVLLGIEPDGDESDYGYIVAGSKMKRGGNAVFQISSFVEKPDYRTAQELTRNGALWNTMMMVFKTTTLMSWIKETSPLFFRVFQTISDALGTPDEEAVIEQIYQELPPLNFSHDFIEPLARSHSAKLLTLPVQNVLWSDWGSESRIMEILRQTGYVTRLNGLTRAPQLTDGSSSYGPRPFVDTPKVLFTQAESLRAHHHRATKANLPMALSKPM